MVKTIRSPRTLHRGDIFLNKYAGWRSLFVYINTSGRYANGVSLVRAQDKNIVQKTQYYKEDLRYDIDAFPLVGHINIQQMWENSVMENLTDVSFFADYDTTGQKKHNKEE